MGYTGTEKKNPFVMTIGFDKNDPEHVEVAEFLNSLPRKKAQYIVEAVRCYRGMQQENAGDVKEEKNAGKQPDKEAIRQIVLQVLAERGAIRREWHGSPFRSLRLGKKQPL